MFIYVALLRLIHIICGVFWVGGDLVYFGFIEPVARKLGPESAKNYPSPSHGLHASPSFRVRCCSCATRICSAQVGRLLP